METQLTHQQEYTLGVQVNPIWVLAQIALPFMVIIKQIMTGCLMTCRAVADKWMLGTSVKGPCHVRKEEKVWP